MRGSGVGVALTKRPVYYERMGGNSTREHLLEVGLERIYSTGYAATGVKEILDFAKVPKGSFYHYFPSKEAFASEVLERYAERESERSARLFSDKQIPPLIRLRGYFDEIASVYGYVEETGQTGGCLLGNLSLEVADHSPALQVLLKGTFQHWMGAIAAVLREAIADGTLKSSVDPEALANFLLNGWEGALVRMKAEKSREPIENFFHFVFEVLLQK